MAGDLFEINHSKVQAYFRCKKQYWFEYVSGIQKPADPMSPAGIVGKGVHRAMQVLCETDSEELGRGELNRYLRMPEHIACSEGTEWFELAHTFYSNGVEFHNQLDTPPDRRWAEKQTWRPQKEAGINVSSRLDRADQIGEKRWQIIDWKTGRFDPDNVTDAQLDLAHVALRTSFRAALKEDHTVRAVAINLRRGGETRVRELVAADAADTVAYYVTVARQIQANTNWLATPGRFCSICKWRPQCPEGSDDDDRLDPSDVEDADE